MHFRQSTSLQIIITVLYPIRQWLPPLLIKLPEALGGPGKNCRFDSLPLRARIDKEVKRSPIDLPGSKAYHLAIGVFPNTRVAPSLRCRRTQPPRKINQVTTGERHTSYKPINKKNIRLTSICPPANDHDSFLPQYSFSHRMPPSPNPPIIPKNNIAEFQRYSPKNTAASIQHVRAGLAPIGANLSQEYLNKSQEESRQTL